MTNQLVAMTPVCHPDEGWIHANDGSMIMWNLGFFGIFCLFLLFLSTQEEEYFYGIATTSLLSGLCARPSVE